MILEGAARVIACVRASIDCDDMTVGGNLDIVFTNRSIPGHTVRSFEHVLAYLGVCHIRWDWDAGHHLKAGIARDTGADL